MPKVASTVRTIIRHELIEAWFRFWFNTFRTEFFENALQTGGTLKTPAFLFRVEGKHFDNEAH